LAIKSPARAAKSVDTAARLSDSGALTEDNAADGIAAERLRSNGVDGGGPFGSVGSGAKPPGGAIVDPFATGAATLGSATAGAVRIGAVPTAAAFMDGAADAIKARSFADGAGAGGAAGAMPRASVLDFALAIPLAIAVCGQGSGAGTTAGCAALDAAGFKAASPLAPSDATQPGRGSNAPSRAGAAAVRVFGRSLLATRVGARAGSRTPLRSVVEVRDLFEAVTTGLPAPAPAGARSVSFVAAFPARAVIKGVAAPFAGFVVAGDERVGRVDAESGACAALLSRGSDCAAAGAGAGTSAGLAGTGADGGVFATGVSTDRDDAGGTGDSDLEGDGDATDATDGADADGPDGAEAAPAARRTKSASALTAPASAARRGKSALPRAIATVVGADDLPRASSTAPLASRSLQADHSCPSSGTLTAASTSTAAAHATRRGRRAGPATGHDRFATSLGSIVIGSTSTPVTIGVAKVATGIAMRVTGVGHSVRSTGCAVAKVHP